MEATSDLAVVTAGPSRPDLPVRREATRASLAAAVEAVRPANVKRAVTELRDNMLAKSTRGPYESRLRTWNRLAFEGRVPAWPITTRTLEVIGAAFRAGAYRSAKEYFLAAFRYQEHDLRLEVDPLLRRFANRVIKAIVRGLPGSRLKEAFPLPALAPLVSFADRAAFDPERAAHSADVFVIAVWFMLREIEVAAARVSDMVVSPGLVVLDLPLHKTATGGERTLTRGAATHAAMRHLVRLGAAGLLSSAGPLFPGKGGGTPVKEESVAFLRGALEAAGLVTTYQDANGIERQVFGGHACRVAGATFLPHGRHPGGPQSHRTVHAVGAGAVGAFARPGRRIQEGRGLSRSPWPTQRPLMVSQTRGAGPAAGLPAVQFVLAVRPEADRPEHFIYLARTRRVHKPDPDEACADRAAWRAVGCGWPYGGRQFFRGRPFAVVASRRGWKAAARLWRVRRARPPGPRSPLLRLTQGLVYLRVRRLDVMTPDRRSGLVRAPVLPLPD